MFDMNRFQKQLDFIIEIDKVKQILRNTVLMDASQCFDNYPYGDMMEIYTNLADLLVTSGVKAEQSAGLHMNYKHSMLGMNETMLHVFKRRGVNIISASDAHCPENAGMYIKEMELL